MERELEVACRLAREAGALILQIYNNQAAQIEWKTATDPVTLADKTANRHIVEGLQREFPTDGILAEESPDGERRLSCDRLWLVDPLDGTKEYIKRNGEFSVMIGLAINGRPAVGAVYQPTANVLYYASANRGAFVVRDGQTTRVVVSSVSDPAQMCLAISRSHRDQVTEKICHDLGIAREVKSGSVGLKVGLIIERHCDLYIHPSTKTRQWDACAPDIILREAGGCFTDIYGDPLTYNHPDTRNRHGLLVSNGQIHEQLVAATRTILKAESHFEMSEVRV